MTKVFVFANMTSKRPGAQKDSTYMEQLFRIRLKFDELSHLTDPSSHDLYKQVEHLSNRLTISVFVLMISAHGKMDKNGTKVLLSDGSIPLNKIITEIKKNKALDRVPKIIMVNCCRHDKRQKFAIIEPKIACPDLLLCFSTRAGEYSDRSPKTGSYYIKSVCEVFSENYKQMPVHRMLPIVSTKVWEASGKQQTPEFTGLKKSIYLLWNYAIVFIDWCVVVAINENKFDFWKTTAWYILFIYHIHD